jgi:hypothetical protein
MIKKLFRKKKVGATINVNPINNSKTLEPNLNETKKINGNKDKKNK